MRGVDYERVAARYDRHRRPSAASVSRWVAAVRERLCDGRLGLAIDVGAGTGQFLDMWWELGADRVMAVEPSSAMRARAARRAASCRAGIVAGTASAVPAASGSAGVVWLSAVIHHLPDLDEAATELGRLLRPGGRLLVRGFFPDSSIVPWLDHLPGADRARDRFPTTSRLNAALDRAGLAVYDVVNVVEPEGLPPADVAAWIVTMRHADSILTTLSDEDIAKGVESLEAMGDTTLEPLALTLVTAVAP